MSVTFFDAQATLQELLEARRLTHMESAPPDYQASVAQAQAEARRQVGEFSSRIQTNLTSPLFSAALAEAVQNRVEKPFMRAFVSSLPQADLSNSKTLVEQMLVDLLVSHACSYVSGTLESLGFFEKIHRHRNDKKELSNQLSEIATEVEKTAMGAYERAVAEISSVVGYGQVLNRLDRNLAAAERDLIKKSTLSSRPGLGQIWAYRVLEAVDGEGPKSEKTAGPPQRPIRQPI